MAQSDFVDPPQAQGYWQVNMSKMAVLFWKAFSGEGALSIASAGQGSSPAPPGFVKTYSYFGSTDNVQTITYSQDGTVVGVVTFTYVGGGGSDGDDVLTETWSAS